MYDSPVPHAGGSLLQGQVFEDDQATPAPDREIVVLEPNRAPFLFASANDSVMAGRLIPGAIVVIPAYNEDRFIGSVVLKALEFVDTVLVVDDGSTDNTALVARAAGAVVIKHPVNGGKGIALETGLRAAQVLAPQVVICLDGDGQHCAEDIPAVAHPVLAGQADLVVGSRFLGRQSNIPNYRIVGQHILTLVTNLFSGIKLTDSQSGFRAFSPRLLKLAAWQASGFAIESEMQFLVREGGLTIMEVPITCIYAEPAKRNPVVHGLEVLNGIIELTSQVRPLLFFSVLSLALLIPGCLAAAGVVQVFNETGQVAPGTALVAVLFSIVGVSSLFEGITLHTLRTFLLGVSGSSRQKKSTRRTG